MTIKVLHVIPSLSMADGGPLRAMGFMAKALFNQGITIEMAATDDGGPRRQEKTGRVESQDEDKSVRRYFPRLLDFYKISPAFAWWIFKNVRGYQLVHIHALFSFTSVMAAWAARLMNVPYVIRPLGTLNQFGMKHRRPLLKKLSLLLLEAPILRHAAAVHFTSDSERHEAEMLGVPMRGVVIPLGVINSHPNTDEKLFLAEYLSLQDRPRVLFLSRLDPKKNVEGLLEAWVRVIQVLPETILIIAGDGEPIYVAELKRRATELGLLEHIIWAGFLDGELKASAFAAADLFVLPSFSENFGIAVAEALAAGLPCVVGEGVAIASAIEEAGAGMAVSPDASSIAEGLLRYLGSAELRIRAGASARTLAAGSFSVEALGIRLKKLYEDILAAHRVRT